MDGGRQQSSQPGKPPKFSVYQNAALSAALLSNSLRPSASTFLFFLSLFSASVIALVISISREDSIVLRLGRGYVSQELACLFSRVIQTIAGLILVGTSLAFVKAITWWRPRNDTHVTVISPSKGTKEQKSLTNRQLGLLGLRPKADTSSTESSRKPPKSRVGSPSPSKGLVPLHQPITASPPSSRMLGNTSSANGGSNIRSFSSPSKSPVSPSLYLVPPPSSRSPSIQNSPGSDQFTVTPWSNKRPPPFHKELATEEGLESFLADVDEKITETTSKLATPPPTINGFGVSSPNVFTSSINTSGTTRSTPLRPVRMSPGSQKFTTPPKKGEGDLPPAMSMEESVEAFQQLGIYPHIEHWRDHLRQWFSSVLLNPLLRKIDTSHIKVMDAAAKLGITITVSQVGSGTPSTTTTSTVSSIEGNVEWQPTFALDEDGLLHQLRASLVQALDTSKLPMSNFQQSPQQNTFVPVLQDCIDTVTEHQRLHSLMKGECVKGLLPQSSVRADYTVQRVRELAEGTCLKNFEYLGSGEVYDKVNKKWTFELPSDSHLLLYLFCAFLEYPNWMLHVDPTAYVGAHSSKNPLFLGILPPKERFPEKYIAVISGVPSVLHPGACILAVGKQSPPIFALYWDKKPQFSLQGRTGLWDSILLLCHKIKIGYSGIVRGMHLGSSALAILPVLDQETEE